MISGCKTHSVSNITPISSLLSSQARIVSSTILFLSGFGTPKVSGNVPIRSKVDGPGYIDTHIPEEIIEETRGSISGVDYNIDVRERFGDGGRLGKFELFQNGSFE